MCGDVFGAADPSRGSNFLNGSNFQEFFQTINPLGSAIDAPVRDTLLPVPQAATPAPTVAPLPLPAAPVDPSITSASTRIPPPQTSVGVGDNLINAVAEKRKNEQQGGQGSNIGAF